MVAFGRRFGRALVIAGLVGAAGCADNTPPSGDPFPILAGRAQGAFTVGFTSDDDPGGAAANPAVVDVLSPITVIDREGAPPRRSGVTLTMLAPPTAGAATVVPRARFDTTALFLHPCATGGPCTIGDPASPTAIGAVIGADTLRGDAIRFEPDTSRMFVLDQIGGSDLARDRVCDARLPAPFYGGGTLVVGDTELTFDGLRIAVDVCLLDATDAARPVGVVGTDAAMVLSTGLGISILGEARYDQYRRARGLPPLAGAETTVLLPAGPLTGHLATIPAIDVGGGGSSSRGACHDAYANRLLTARDCEDGDDCPCGNDPFCAAPSVLELNPAAPVDVLVVADTEPMLQALRAEVRPARPEIDGILGMNALAGAVVDVDYPHNRVLFRCVPPPAGCTPQTTPACEVRPALSDTASRPVIEGCVAAARCETPTSVPR